MVKLRPADVDDALFVWECRQSLDGAVARSTTHRESFEGHVAWMTRAVRDTSRLFAIATDAQDTPLGYVRADPASNGGWLVSLCLASAYRGKGLSQQILDRGCEHALKNGLQPLLADIHSDNPASRKVFANCGFRPLGHHSSYSIGLRDQFTRYILDDLERNEQ